MCLQREGLAGEDADRFRSLARILGAFFHFEFQDTLHRLTDGYAPFDPDRDTRRIRDLSDSERSECRRQLVDGLTEVLRRGNYVRIPEEDIHRAMAEESLFRIRLHVDLTDFEEILFFRRGETVRREKIRRLFGLGTKEIEVPTYDRVAVYVHFKERDWFDAKKRKNLPFQPGSMLLKLFSNIPRADLEMLFPNSQIRMKPIDKIVMGVPALAGIVVIVATKLAAVIGLIAALILFWLGVAEDRPTINSARLVALGAGLAAFGSYLAKQWMNYKNRKIRFMKALTENLYYRNLDNNAGVLKQLVDRAEGEELKEAILAYRFLLEEEDGLTLEELDARIERWLAERWEVDVDFDAEDALGKLERLGLARREQDNWRVLPLEEALRELDRRWDGAFDFGSAPATD